jgi:hypothetical protein
MTTNGTRIVRIVRPETDVLTLTHGDTITIKRRLNNGERRAMFSRMYHKGVEPQRVDTLQTGLAMVVAYLLDWNLIGEDGAVISIRDLTPDDLAIVLDGLDPDHFAEIKEAIEDHIARQEVAMEQEKKARAGASASSATSPSAA